MTTDRLILAVLSTAAVTLALGAGNASAATPGPYRTDDQAARYLQQTRGGQAFCLNGYYSSHEKRTHRHFPWRKVVTPRGYVHYKYRSFACSLSDATGTRQLYVQTRPGAWVVIVDR